MQHVHLSNDALQAERGLFVACAGLEELDVLGVDVGQMDGEVHAVVVRVLDEREGVLDGLSRQLGDLDLFGRRRGFAASTCFAGARFLACLS